jgi:hypothetical protein
MKLTKLFIVTGLAFFAFACQMMQPAPTPSDTFKAYVEAIKKKDAAAAKQLVSKNSLKMMEDAAKAQDKTVDELLTGSEAPALKETPETRNEKIQGDTATLEVKNNVSGSWDMMHLVKEDGRWKLALDKTMEEIMKKVEEQMKNFNQSMPKSGDDEDNKSGPDTEKKK